MINDKTFLIIQGVKESILLLATMYSERFIKIHPKFDIVQNVIFISNVFLQNHSALQFR